MSDLALVDWREREKADRRVAEDEIERRQSDAEGGSDEIERR